MNQNRKVHTVRSEKLILKTLDCRRDLLLLFLKISAEENAGGEKGDGGNAAKSPIGDLGVVFKRIEAPIICLYISALPNFHFPSTIDNVTE